MYAAHLFNLQEACSIATIYGVVTTGTIWRFIKLSGNSVYIDVDEYYLKEVSILMAIFLSIVQQNY